MESSGERNGVNPSLEDDVQVVRHVPLPVNHVPLHQVGPPQPGREEADRLEIEALRRLRSNCGQTVVKLWPNCGQTASISKS